MSSKVTKINLATGTAIVFYTVPSDQPISSLNRKARSPFYYCEEEKKGIVRREVKTAQNCSTVAAEVVPGFRGVPVNLLPGRLRNFNGRECLLGRSFKDSCFSIRGTRRQPVRS
jgi:hypothetical protein